MTECDVVIYNRYKEEYTKHGYFKCKDIFGSISEFIIRYKSMKLLVYHIN